MTSRLSNPRQSAVRNGSNDETAGGAEPDSATAWKSREPTPLPGHATHGASPARPPYSTLLATRTSWTERVVGGPRVLESYAWEALLVRSAEEMASMWSEPRVACRTSPRRDLAQRGRVGRRQSVQLVTVSSQVGS